MSTPLEAPQPCPARQDELQDLQRLSRLIQRISIADSTAEAMQIACRCLVEDFGFFNVVILVPGTPDDHFIVGAACGAYAGQLFRDAPRFPRDSGLIGRAATTRRTVIVNETTGNPDFYQLEGMAIRSEAVLPLLVEGTLVGVLSVDSDVPDSFSPRNVAPLEVISQRITLALDRARLVDTLREELRERERAEAEARRSVSLLNAALNSTADGILIINTHGRVVGWNREFQRLWAIPDDLLQAGDDRRMLDFVLGQLKHPEPFLRRVQELYATPAVVSFDALEFRDGRIVERYSQPQMLDGRIEGRVWSFRDVTARHEAEQGQRRAEQQLFRSRKMEALGTLAGGIAHDFNNILGAILGNTELLSLSPVVDDPAAADSIEEIRNASHRARDLIQKILTFTRQREGQKSVILLEPVIQEVLKLVRASLPAGIVIRSLMASTPTAVLADAGQIHQVMMNLAANAGYAMRQSGGTLTVSTERVDLTAGMDHSAGRALPPGAYVRIVVADTGHGIPGADLHRIFDPFFTTKPTGEGTGLGLSVAHGIIQEHGGAITAQSEVGGGSRFQILLPAVAAPPPPAGPPLPEPQPRGSGERVLIVDDEPSLGRVATALLQRLGYAPDFCQSPLEAIDRVESGVTYRLVITDLNMPQMNGITLAEELRRRGHRLPILLMSGFASGSRLGHRLSTAVQGFIEKPFDSAELARAVEASLAAPVQATV
jgi:signal transduction histidine kinase/CheY-like chemotaxis protein